MAYKSEDGNVYVWTVVDTTGKICNGEHVVDSDDEFYDLVDGFEWKRFKLVPVS